MQDKNSNQKDDRLENLDYLFNYIIFPHLLIVIGIAISIMAVTKIENKEDKTMLFTFGSGLSTSGAYKCQKK